MKITIKHKRSNIVFSLDGLSSDPDETYAIQKSNLKSEQSKIPHEAIEVYRDDLLQELNSSYGHYGHLVSTDSVTSLDLLAAIAKLESFDIVDVEEPVTPSKFNEGEIS